MGRGGERSPCFAFAGWFRERVGSGRGETAQSRGVTLGPPPRWRRVSYLRVTARVPSEIPFPGVFSLHQSLPAAAVARNALVQMHRLQRGFVFLKVFVEAEWTEQAAGVWALTAGVGANPQPSAQSNAPWGFYAILRAQRYSIQRGNIPQMSP